MLAFGDASLSDSYIQTTAAGLLNNIIPNATITYSSTVAVPFHFMSSDVTQSRARVVTVGSGDWATAMTATSSGAVNQDITKLVPFVSAGIMNGILVDANNFFNPSNSLGITRQVVTGSTQRFATTCFIEIVGTSPSAGPMPGVPMGLIVMMAGGASIYKFYNPGCLEGDGKWRRI
jgi:hypothetical protein